MTKQEILNYIFKSKDGASWNEVSEMLNEFESDIEQCNIIDVVRQNERFFSCDCKGEGLLLTQDKEGKNICFSLYGHGVGYNAKPSLLERIKYAWYHIKTGKMFDDCIIMNYQKAREVSKWIYSNTR